MENSAGRANLGFIAAIVAVAAIGGLLFGYDSGAVNGTQPGLKAAFGLSDAGLGVTVGSLLIGCFVDAAGKLQLSSSLGTVALVAAGADLAVSYAVYAVAAAISFFPVRRAIVATKGRELEAMAG